MGRLCILPVLSVPCPVTQLCEAYSPLPALCSIPLTSLVGASSSLGGVFCLQTSHPCSVATAMFSELFGSSVELASSKVAIVRKTHC